MALLAFMLLAGTVLAAERRAGPLILPLSEYWHGNDGAWSSFPLQVGTPSNSPRLQASFHGSLHTAQLVFVLPGTSATAANTIWVILPEGCEQANPDLEGCAERRGNLFSRNASTTWSTSRLANDGLYNVALYEENRLGLTANAYYGFDSVSLGLPGSGLPMLSQQTVACIGTNDFFLGTLGLSPLPLNFSSANEPLPSILGSLTSPNESLVPSATWAYTAGAVYKSPPVFGSLTFGGYDAKRVDMSKSVSVPFWTDQSRDLLLGVQSLTSDTLGSSPLMSSGIYMFVNSLVSQIWLPVNVCQEFESQYGIVWNETYELYLLDNSTRASLRAQNPTFQFVIGSSSDSEDGNSTTISIPYAAFDLEISAPYFNDSRPYFPLKRAQNASQYTLGRTFLQEAYVIAEYDRKNFTVGQALFPDRAEQEPVAIYPPGFARERDGGLSSGAIAGIVVAAVVVIAAVALLVYWLVKIRRQSQKPAPEVFSFDQKSGAGPDHPASEVQEVHRPLVGFKHAGELRGDDRHPEKAELLGEHTRSELPGHAAGPFELPEDRRYELDAGHVAARELHSTSVQKNPVSGR